MRIISLVEDGKTVGFLTIEEFERVTTGTIQKLVMLKKAEGTLPHSEKVLLDKLLDYQHQLITKKGG